MALGGCYTCLKYLMFVFNFIFWLIGCALLTVGIWAKVEEKSLSELIKNDEIAYSLSVYAWVIIAVGAVVLVLGFLGCCGAIRESQFMLATFFVFLFLIFAALLTLGVYAFVKWKQDKGGFEDKLADQISKEVGEYETDNKTRVALDTLHKEFHCCGAVKGDFLRAHGVAKTIETCGKDYESDEGCAKKIMEALTSNLVIVVAVALGIAVIMLLGMIFSMLLCCAIREIA